VLLAINAAIKITRISSREKKIIKKHYKAISSTDIIMIYLLSTAKTLLLSIATAALLSGNLLTSAVYTIGLLITIFVYGAVAKPLNERLLRLAV